VENNLTNIRIFCTDIYFSPHGTTLTALLQMSVYRCSRMLDGLVSSHPNYLIVTRILLMGRTSMEVTSLPQLPKVNSSHPLTDHRKWKDICIL